MTSQTSVFVFIDEDQQKKYSKNTLSAINAQVAKYAHKRRLGLPKPETAKHPSPILITSHGVEPNTKAPRFKRTGKHLLLEHQNSGLSLSKSINGKNGTSRGFISSKASPQSSAVRDIQDEHESEGCEVSNEKQEELHSIFERLCRITKLPTYQDFAEFLNPQERKLTHYWLQEVIQDDFGLSRARFENSFQSCLVKYPLSYQVPLRWMIAHAALQLHQRTGSQTIAVIYRNQQEALTKLRGVLLDPATSTDEVISSLHHTIVHDAESRKLHLRGSDAIIEARGGMEKVLEHCKIIQPDHILIQYTFAPFEIDRYQELETLKRHFFGTLLNIQASAAEYLQIKSETGTWASSVDLAHHSAAGGTHIQNWQYVQQRERLFSPETISGRLLRREFECDATSIVKSRLFAALFYVGTMLLEYDATTAKYVFFQELEKSADILTPVCIDATTGAQRILPGTFIFMVAHVNRQLGEQDNDASGAHRKGIRTAVASIGALKLYNLFSDTIREQLHLCLQNWVLGQHNAYLTQTDFDMCSNVITQAWLQQQTTSRATSVPSQAQVSASNLQRSTEQPNPVMSTGNG